MEISYDAAAMTAEFRKQHLQFFSTMRQLHAVRHELDHRSSTTPPGNCVSKHKEESVAFERQQALEQMLKAERRFEELAKKYAFDGNEPKSHAFAKRASATKKRMFV